MGEATAQISVVIPVHNGARYLGEAIESVCRQTVPPNQILVVDDGSTDDSATVARGFAQVEYLFQENAGAATARNRGVTLARGEYLAFLDADDLWVPQKLEWQLAALQNQAACDVVFGHVEQFASPDLSAEDREKIHIPHPLMAAYSPGALLMRRADFLLVGEFEPQWGVGEFIDWYLKAIDAGLQTQVLPEVVLRRRVHTANMGRLKQDARNDYVRIAKATLDRRRKMSGKQ